MTLQNAKRLYEHYIDKKMYAEAKDISKTRFEKKSKKVKEE